MDKSASSFEAQQKHRIDAAAGVLDALLQSAGFDAGDLELALTALKQAKEQKVDKKDAQGKIYYLDKEFIYPDADAFIFRRATSKSGVFYWRFYDDNNKKAVIQSLKTTDRIQALTNARVKYVEVLGKVQRGERLTCITTEELIKLRQKQLDDKTTSIPHRGIVPDSNRLKRTFHKYWIEFVNQEIGGNDCDFYKKTRIDRIKPYKFRQFGVWLQNKPKKTALHKSGRSFEFINNAISEIIATYQQIAVRERYISTDLVPQIDRLKEDRDETYKNEILNEDQYRNLWKYINDEYCPKKKNPQLLNSNRGKKELIMRRLFAELIGILASGGFRPKEVLGIRMMDLTQEPLWDDAKKKTHMIIRIPRENSKTGKGRRAVAPIKKRVERIVSAYKELGFTHQPSDFLFINPSSKEFKSFGRGLFYQRLKKVLIASGLQDELDKTNTSINLYSFRHQYATWRLRYGNTPIHLLSKQMGTSVQKIEDVYGHILVEKQVDVITKNQGFTKDMSIVMDKIEPSDLSDED